ncbi:PHB depolymerase family esterase [Isosphaeraceae bacterium EP7]
MRRMRKLLERAAFGLTLTGLVVAARADIVTLKNGTVLKGAVDKDNTVVSVFDGLKRVIVRDTKIAKTDPEATYANAESFRFIQPLEKHAGSMPRYAIGIKAGPWSDRARRSYQYVGPKSSKPVAMTQAIIDLGPRISKLRGVDEFWTGQIPTSTLPRDVVMGLLGNIIQKENKSERLAKGRFLIQAEWYPEAMAELASIEADFPEEKENIGVALRNIRDLEARRVRAEIDVRRSAGQPKKVAELLKGFPTGEGVSEELLQEVRDLLKQDEDQAAADRALAEQIRTLPDELIEVQDKADWKNRMIEVLRFFDEAPDAIRPRFEPLLKADSSLDARGKLALAVSGYVLGAEGAVSNLDDASTLWKARDIVRRYLASRPEDDRPAMAAELQALSRPGPDGATLPMDFTTVGRIARVLPPPLMDSKESPKAIRTHRVRDDASESPTEYTLMLPPEYHPLRSYPLVVALHSGRGPASAIDWWQAEATRRGYIVLAPEYNLPDQSPDYRYSATEHAAVELALRDARRRYSVDSDRIYLGGQLLGGNMAFDFGLAHPDLFAGVVVVSGLPAKYVPRYTQNAQNLPLYAAYGEFAPAANEVIFGTLLKPLISKGWDVTYVEYQRRGLEEFPEEAVPAFDWMDRRRRDPYPKAFKFDSARGSDNRFFGVVIDSHHNGRTTEPDAVDPVGKNLNPARVELKIGASTNLVNLKTAGVRRLYIWLGPAEVDFSKRVELRVNDSPKPVYRAVPPVSFGPMLDDLRIRGDRQQMYALKIPVG